MAASFDVRVAMQELKGERETCHGVRPDAKEVKFRSKEISVEKCKSFEAFCLHLSKLAFCRYSLISIVVRFECMCMKLVMRLNRILKSLCLALENFLLRSLNVLKHFVCISPNLYMGSIL